MASNEELNREKTAIRCARDTMLLYSLASSRSIDAASEERERGESRREIDDLRRRITMEKKRMNRIKLCGLTELLLLVVLVMLLSTFLLVTFFGSTRFVGEC